MATHKPITTPGIYFITFTCFNWLPLIEITNAYDCVYNWFDILTDNGHSINGFVIMPNHNHLILHYAGGSQSLNTIVGNGKRFMAYNIIERLNNRGETALIKKLSSAVQPSDRRRGKKHEVWQETFDVKECRTEKFILQKLNYIHNNPCSGKWKLVQEPHHYQHSSALFYLNGKTTYFQLRDYRDFLSMYDTQD